MNPGQIFRWNLLQLGVVMSICSMSFGADDDVILEENSKPENAEIIDHNRLVRLEQIQVQRVRFRFVPVISDEDFERRIFAQDVTAQRGRWKINADLDLAIHRIDRTCFLTKVQLQKLAMAGRIDRSRFFDRVDAARKRIRSNELNADELTLELEALRKQSESGILGPGSFFAKSVRTVLMPEQLQICQQPHQHALIEKTVSLIEKQASFQPSSREAFVKLLQDEIPDVAVFWADEKYYGSAEMKEMRHRLSLLADLKAKPLLTDSQSNALRAFINHVDEAAPRQVLNVGMDKFVIFEKQARP